MDNTIILYNNALNFSLKQNVNNMNDMLFNLQNLKLLQYNIEQIQGIKDKVQMQTNMASLALLRSYILDERLVGRILFRNLIRSFYPLNDEQILKYENIFEHHQYNITNINVLRRKGAGFICKVRVYRLRPYRHSTLLEIPHYNIMREISSREELSMYMSKEERSAKTSALYVWDMFYALNRHIDLSDESILTGMTWQKDINFLLQNEDVVWTWEIIEKIKERHQNLKWHHLVENKGFIAQMGVTSIDNTLQTLQTITGLELTEKDKNDILAKYGNIGIKLYSYLPTLDKSFIIEHQNELDWKVLVRNSHIQWDLELINLLLKYCLNNVSETDWNMFLEDPSYAIYQAIEPFLNDELLNDIEKLYDI